MTDRRERDGNGSPSSSLFVPPQDLDAERFALGALMCEREVQAQMLALLLPEHFYRPEHAAIYEAIRRVAAQDRAIDLVTLKAELERAGDLDRIGGVTYLAEIAQRVATPAHGPDYGRIVVEVYRRRQAFHAAVKLLGEIGRGTQDGAMEGITRCASVMNSILLSDPQSRLIPLGDLAKTLPRKRTQAPRSIGIPELDEIADFTAPGSYVIVGGRPSMGKSSLLRQMAFHYAGAAVPVLYVPLEESAQAVATHFVALAAHVESSRIDKNTLTAEDLAKIDAIRSLTDALPIMLLDRSGITVATLRAHAEQFFASKGSPGVVVVDYLQLMQHPESRNRVEAITVTSLELRNLARALDCSVLAAVSLNRAPESREDNEPYMADIRECGQVEADATHIVFVWSQDPNENARQIKLEKHRSGPTRSPFAVTFLRDKGGAFLPYHPPERSESGTGDEKSERRGRNRRKEAHLGPF